MNAQRIFWGTARAGWLLGYGLLALLWLGRGEWQWAMLAGILGLIALIASYGRRAWVASINFLVLGALSGVGTLWSNWVALTSVLCGLIAWDTELFARRLESFPDVPDTVVWAHLRRLGVVAALGGALGAGALSWRVSLGFGWALLIAFGFLVAFVFLLRQGVR
ncbi:MAG: hypothetical protein K6T71_00520 [Candidatus Bipolaricaulota bacterium]|nr:hypothetical protein [Candidatus Bipolaricaulota bacterium]